MTLSFTIPGAPRTKKNHGYRTKQGRQMPSKTFQKWNSAAQYCLIAVRRQINLHPNGIADEVNCRALFYRHALVGDAVGFYQALADALEEGRIVENDRFIVSWNGSQLLKDAKKPRIEVTLETI